MCLCVSDRARTPFERVCVCECMSVCASVFYFYEINISFLYHKIDTTRQRSKSSCTHVYTDFLGQITFGFGVGRPRLGEYTHAISLGGFRFSSSRRRKNPNRTIAAATPTPLPTFWRVFFFAHTCTLTQSCGTHAHQHSTPIHR